MSRGIAQQVGMVSKYGMISTLKSRADLHCRRNRNVL